MTWYAVRETLQGEFEGQQPLKTPSVGVGVGYGDAAPHTNDHCEECDMTIDIRPLKIITEYQTAEELQRLVFGLVERMIVPLNILVTVQRDGGIVLGAFDSDHNNPHGFDLVGFVFSFPGFTPTGKLKHCSHMAAVLPEYQNMQLGYRLKCAQREFVLAQHIDCITWTFNPLISRNAYFNLHKLGAICSTYLCNIYGTSFGTDRVVLPTDRFHVAWHITSPDVVARIEGTHTNPSLADLHTQGVPVINPLAPDESLFNTALPDTVLLQFPRDIQAIKAADMQQARQWQQRIRTICQHLFEHGYVAVDALRDDAWGYYVIRSVVQ